MNISGFTTTHLGEAFTHRSILFFFSFFPRLLLFQTVKFLKVHSHIEPELHSTLYNIPDGPCTLMHWCRHVIRKNLTHQVLTSQQFNLWKCIPSLPLPKQILDYLLYWDLNGVDLVKMLLTLWKCHWPRHCNWRQKCQIMSYCEQRISTTAHKKQLEGEMSDCELLLNKEVPPRFICITDIGMCPFQISIPFISRKNNLTKHKC